MLIIKASGPPHNTHSLKSLMHNVKQQDGQRRDTKVSDEEKTQHPNRTHCEQSRLRVVHGSMVYSVYGAE